MIETPNSLLRYFKKEEHACQFVSGSARFGILEYYREIEDVRRDASEGRSSVYFRAPHPIYSTVISLNRYYILSTAHADADVSYLARKYGYFMVRINSPQELLARIQAAWQNHELAQDDGAFIAPVEYTKDELRDADASYLSPVYLTYSQKHRSYEEDREYRYLLKCKVDVKRVWESHLILTLPDCEDICTLSTVRE
ncbi:MAG TPA: hypothetical protein VN901_27245 [Candidatus Acidoferrales bacterium]|nr:hypothetical protein [Candidatus Acidoferrales bacterium]